MLIQSGITSLYETTLTSSPIDFVYSIKLYTKELEGFGMPFSVSEDNSGVLSA